MVRWCNGFMSDDFQKYIYIFVVWRVAVEAATANILGTSAPYLIPVTGVYNWNYDPICKLASGIDYGFLFLLFYSTPPLFLFSSGAKASRESSLKFTIRPICLPFPFPLLPYPSYPAVNSSQSRGMTRGNLTAMSRCTIQGNIPSCSCLSYKDGKYLLSVDTPPGSFIFMILFYSVF